jgi:hypothetical protein
MKITLLFLIFGIWIIFMAKNNNAYKCHGIIQMAIYKYQLQCILSDMIPVVSYDDMESYSKTLFRLWNWNYTKILPKEKFEIIKEYIEKGNGGGKL